MKQVSFILSTLVLLAACNSNPKTDEGAKKADTTAVAAKPADTSTPKMDSAAMMKAWQDYMTPGPMHKVLASMAGKWKVETTMWMSPGAQPMTSTTESENTMIMGGRYMEQKVHGDMGGMQFEGLGTFAYDNAKKMFLATWVDNMGTGIVNFEGPYDEATKTISIKGKCLDPSTGKDGEMRETIKIVDDNNETMEIYFTPAGGKEFKNTEMKLTRATASAMKPTKK